MIQGSPLFPFPRSAVDLPNGLRVVVVPTGYPEIVALEIVVAVGSRNEVEPGYTGFAHFFEHMMFRGTLRFPAEEANRILKDAGADQNAYTTDDFTCYHTTFLKDALRSVLEIEADRFQHLQYDEAPFRTEAKAVLGEYNKNCSDPFSKLLEAQRAQGFVAHPYRHTTMGFLDDIKRMPEAMAFSRQFFDRFYRPERTTIILAGDLEIEQTHALVAELFGAWQASCHQDVIPREPAPNGPVHHHVEYPSETMPWVSVAFRGPSAAEDPDAQAAMDVVAELGFSSGSPLAQRLVVKEQRVDQLVAYFPPRVDPYLLTVYARTNRKEDAPAVIDAILEEFATLRHHLVDERRLRDIKSNLRFRFSTSLDHSAAVASALARTVAYDRDPSSLDRRVARYDTLTSQEIRDAARRYVNDQGLLIVTLAHGALPPFVSRSVEAPPADTTGAASPARQIQATSPPAVTPLSHAPASDDFSSEQVLLLPGSGPVLDYRIVFRVGATSDPKGQEGLAHLTAMMIVDAGSREMSYSEIQQAHFRRASSFEVQVDKEMTVFIGKGHPEHGLELLSMTLGQLMFPGFSEEDFRRVRLQVINQIRVGLRANNDEELAKEVLLEALYEDHPYGALTKGHLGALEALTLDDVRQFFREHFCKADARFAVAGNAPTGFVEFARSLLRNLPAGPAPRPTVPRPRILQHTRVTIVEKTASSVALSLGFPIAVTRGHADFPALLVARSYLGEHRSSNSLLFQRMREARGLNYGDYAYIEYFPRGMFQFHPNPNLVRSEQAFQIWIRPVLPEHTHFSLRLALFELERLRQDGIPEADFEATRRFLARSAPLLQRTQGLRLGYLIDSNAYGIPPYDRFIEEGLASLTKDSVDTAIRRHLGGEGLHIVAVTPDAGALAKALATDAPSPITYDSEKPGALLREDEVVARMPLNIRGENIDIRALDDVFA